jgi:hypothetical protein
MFPGRDPRSAVAIIDRIERSQGDLAPVVDSSIGICDDKAGEFEIRSAINSRGAMHCAMSYLKIGEPDRGETSGLCHCQP